MKRITITKAAVLAAVLAVTLLPVRAAEKPAKAGQPAVATAAKPKPYTLKTCVVSDEKLGEMGEPFVLNYKGREIKMCCEGCRKDFDKNPAKFMKKLEAAERKAAATEKKPVETPGSK